MTDRKLKTSDELFRMIKEASSRKQTAEEVRKQRVSFIYGSISQSSGITRDRIANVLDVQEGKIAK